jgi:hypothetical protein
VCLQVLKCLGILGRGNAAATEVMTDTLAKVAAAHAAVPSTMRGARSTKSGANTTSAAIGTEAAATIMNVEPVPMLRTYAVQIMANFLKQSDNNMRCAGRPRLQQDLSLFVVAVGSDWESFHPLVTSLGGQDIFVKCQNVCQTSHPS